MRRQPRGFGRRRRRLDADEAVEALSARPLISVVMPVYETPVRYLREAIESVRRQTYPAWELCIADDGSRDRRVRRTIARQAARDQRIVPLYLGENAGISAASNAALERARGEYVAFLDHDDVLTEDALLEAARALTADRSIEIAYSDSDKLDGHGRLVDPFLKPDWSPVYALGAMYIGHLLVVRRSLVVEAGGFDSAYDTIQDFELLLRLSERTDRIHHIPRVLYHWRAIPGSIAAGAEQKPGAGELQARAVGEHLRRIGASATAESHPEIPHRVQLALAEDERDSVSVVVISRGDAPALRRLLDSIERIDSPAIAELIVDPAPGVSRARRANLGAAKATAQWLLFVDETVELTERDSIERLLAHARLPGVGAVGPLLVRPDGRTDAAGLAIGLDAPVLPMLRGLAAGQDGYYGSLACAREVSALSADCLLVAAEAFREVDGFSEWYASEYDDFDLCQRLAERGRSSVYAPRPRVTTHERPADRRERSDVIDRALYVDRWYERLERGDPYFNRGFRSAAADYTVAG